jgi:membrane protease YdiL (CAAX protease family)
MLIDFINLNLIVFIFTAYNYINIVRNNNIYFEFTRTFRNKNKIIANIKTSIRGVIVEDIIFRVYLHELLTYFIINRLLIKFIVATCFSLAHISNYYIAKEDNIHNIRLTISQMIFTFILSYYYLQEESPLLSMLLHQYVNLVAIFFNYLFFY